MRALPSAIAFVLLFAIGSTWSSVPVSPSKAMVYTVNGSPYVLPVAGGAAKRIAVSHAVRYDWSADGKYLLVQSAGLDGLLRILNGQGRLIRTLPIAVRYVAGFGWDENSDTVVLATLVSPNPSCAGSLTCVGHAWSVFYRVGLSDAPKLLWPHSISSQYQPVVAGAGISYAPLFGDPALSALKGELLRSEATVLYSSRRHVIVYDRSFGRSAAKPWRVLNTRTGGHWKLPFGDVSGPLGVSGLFSGGPVDWVTLSRSGNLAGQIGGRVATMPLRRKARPVVIGAGYAPVWSPDGRWLYYVAGEPSSTLRFQMRVKVPGVFTCMRKGKLNLQHCNAAS